MKRENQEMYELYWWMDKMPAYPEVHFAGAKLALDRWAAGSILVAIACGLDPKAAFASQGISARTYNRYLKRAQIHSAGAENALPEHSNQVELDRYLYAYFELQSMALEIADIQRTRAEVHLQQGYPTRRVVNRTITKKREVMVGREVLVLTTVTNIQGHDTSEHRPRPRHKIIRANDDGT
jgi:hypothetical protein